MKKTPSFHQSIALFIILVVVCLACWIGYLDYCAAKIQHPEVWVALLGISYLAHIHLKLSLHGYKDVNHHLWATRIMIISLSLIPVVVHTSAPPTPTEWQHAKDTTQTAMNARLRWMPNPVAVRTNSYEGVQQASIINFENLLPIILLAVIEGLLIVYCFIYLKKKPRGNK